MWESKTGRLPKHEIAAVLRRSDPIMVLHGLAEILLKKGSRQVAVGALS